MKSLSAKISIFGIGICLFTGIVFSIYSHYQQKSYLLNSSLDESVDALLLLEESVKLEIDQLKSDVRFLASTPPIKGILRAHLNGGIDPQDNSTEKLWKDRLTIIFEEMLYAKGRYNQIRYIGVDDGGRELVRVNKDGVRVRRVIEKNLQRKGDAEYFKEALEVSDSQVYLSDFSLNKEFGKVIIPEQLVLRAAVPIEQELNNKFGAVVINVDYTEIFKNLNLILSKGKEFYIINSNRILAHGKNERFNYEIRNLDKTSLSDIYKEIGQIRDREEISKFKHLTHKIDGTYYIEKRIFYNDIHPNEYLSLLVEVSEANLLANLDDIIQKNIIALAFILLIALLISMIFSKIIGKPINKLKDIIDNIKNGEELDDSEFRESINSNDEIGFVAKTIVNLSKDLLDKNMDLMRQQKALDISAIVVETDVKGKIIFVNENFVRISKYLRDELIGQDHRIINSGTHSKDFFKNMWSTILDGRTWKGEVKNRAKDGSFYWVDTTIHPYLRGDGSIEKFVAIRFDITEKKQTMDELISAKNSASVALEAKTNFLANMSHEIRTPLNGILGFTTMLLEKDLKGESREYVDQIKGCSESLLMLINDILDLSKIDSGKLSLESIVFDLSKTIESTCVVFSALVQKKNIELLYTIDDDVPQFVKSDPLRLRQVLLNLIGNAIKFTETGTVKARVSLVKKEEKNITLKFSIIDTGIGISVENQKKLFSPFVQADTSTTREFGGSGLGLSICHKLVEAFGGEIWVDSNHGRGATFSFSYTAEVVAKDSIGIVNEESHAITAPTSLDNIEALNILIVEDNLINQKISKKYLESIGVVQISIAGDGVEAVKICEHRKFDIIFMDVQMPNMDGLEATRRLRADQKCESYIIGLSANVFKEDRDNGIQAGMDDYLGKPIKKEVLLSVIGKYLGNNSKKAS